MCSLLDGKRLRLLESTIDLYRAVNKEAKRIGMEVDSSEISSLINEAQTLIISPLSDGGYHLKRSDGDLTEPCFDDLRASPGTIWLQRLGTLSYGPIEFDSTLRLLVLDSEIDPDANRAILDQPVREGRRHVRPEIPKRVRSSETDQTAPRETHPEPWIGSVRSLHAEKGQVRDEPHPYAKR